MRRVVERHHRWEDSNGATTCDAQLFPRLLVIDVPPQLHSVVKHSADDQYVALATTDEEVSRPANRLAGRAGATLRQVPREYAVAQFRSGGVLGIIGARSRVADCCGDQDFIALACFLTELFL